MKVNETLHGFRFTRSRELPELSAVLHEAVYEKNGARLVFIEREEVNKTFSISFKTIPEDDTGVFHIIEHSVLCGSDKYPVKEPFVELLKSSLKTFLNAMTFPDKTMYPISTRNDKDFLNLVSVYMDAVLHPVAMKRPEIFYQEGWHHELHSEDGEMLYKGVVFNEMKGAYSSVDDVEMELITKLLYPDVCYGYDSGGDPISIPNLTYEQFVSSHAKYYHPSNSYIFLDGKINLDETLSLLDSFLSEYDYLEINADIPMQKKLGYTENTSYYEVAKGDAEGAKTRICLGFDVGTFDERRKVIALNVITDAIAGSNDAPFKKAMLDSGFCEDAYFVSYDGIQENSLLLGIKNVKEEDKERAVKLALDTIRSIVNEGIDREALTAAFNIMEFRAREQDTGRYPAGIAYAISSLDSWLYGGDPLAALSFEEDFTALRTALDTDYYEKLLEETILNSKHSACLYMLPSETLGEERLAEERARLEADRAALGDEGIKETIKRTEALEAWQKSADTKEALDTIPMLSVDDVEKNIEPFPTEKREALGKEYLYTPVASRGITYTTLAFDITDFGKDELFYTTLLTELIKQVATENYTAAALQTKLKTELGSFSVSVSPTTTADKKTKAYFITNVSCLDSKKNEVISLAREVLLSSKFDDKSAISKIVRQLKTAMYEAFSGAGHTIAISRAAAGVIAESALGEHLGGIEFYLKLKELDKDFDNRFDTVVKNLYAIVNKTFVKERLIPAYAGAEDIAFAENCISAFPSGETAKADTSAIKPFGKRSEGVAVPAQISFAGMVGNALDLCDAVPGYMPVIRTILSYSYLWNEVRVQGGAYGAGYIHRASGACGYYSYRDPDANRTLGKYLGSADYLRGLAASDEDITGFIIGAVGDSDPLMTPKSTAAMSFSAYLRGETNESRQARRDELLATNKETLAKAADVIEKLTAEASICVVGGKDKLTACGEKLDTIIEV